MNDCSPRLCYSGAVFEVLGFGAALVGKAIGVEFFHRRQEKKRLLSAVVVDSGGSPEHSGEASPLPKLLSGPVEQGVLPRGH